MHPVGVDARAAVTRRLTELGWVASWGQLAEVAPRSALTTMVASGELVRVAHGRYAAPLEIPERLAAARVGGVVSHLSAARHYGWAMMWPPPRPSVTVPRWRKVTREQQRRIRVSWRDLSALEVSDGWVTSPVQTVVDCAATLPFDQALTIADSALRSTRVTRRELEGRVAFWPGRGRARVTRVVAHADGRSSGPIESVLRAICLEVPGLSVEPQVKVTRAGRVIGTVDLADKALRIIIEAEGFEFHGDRLAFDRDCWRYDECVAAGWVVLRFTWDHVMNRPEWVREILEHVVATRRPVVA